jgi:putative membrane protein
MDSVKYKLLIFLFAVLASVGVSALNEIMEFVISITMENGVGGYENTMLDMCFNFVGALVGASLYARFGVSKVS